jgi:hypothetical protein
VSFDLPVALCDPAEMKDDAGGFGHLPILANMVLLAMPALFALTTTGSSPHIAYAKDFGGNAQDAARYYACFACLSQSASNGIVPERANQAGRTRLRSGSLPEVQADDRAAAVDTA